MRIAIATAVCLSIIGLSVAADAEAAIKKFTNIPAQGLGAALQALAKERKLSVVYVSEIVNPRSTEGLVGDFTTNEAFEKLLNGTGLTYRYLNEETVTIVPLATAPAEKVGGAGAALPERLIRVAQADPGNGAGGRKDSVEAGSDALEEVVVTAKDFRPKRISTGTKTDTPLLEAPQSISVLTADRIEAIGARRLKEALAYTPGVNTSPWGDESQYDWVYLRGFDAYSPGFYLDGLQLRNSGTWGVWQTENYGAEQVEFLRGPSSALYGQNGPGGIVNIVSKQPREKPLRELKAQMGNYSHRQLAADFSGPIDDGGEWLYRFTTLRQDAELSTGGLRNDRLYVAPALTWRPSEDTTLTLLGQFLRIRSGSVWNNYPAYGTLLPNPNGKIPVSTFTGERDFNRYDQDQWMIGYLLNHRVNDTWTLSQSARHGRFDSDYKTMYGLDFITVNADDPADPANFRTVNRIPFSSLEEDSAILVDNRAVAKLSMGGWQHTVLFGVDYQRTVSDVYAIYGGDAAPLDIYDPVFGQPVTLGGPFLDSRYELLQTGFYLQDQVKFTERWIATLSGRYDRASVSSRDRLWGGRTKQSDEAFTGRLGLVYLTPEGWAPYLSYSESFSPNILTDPMTGNPFDPETGRQYELGIRYQPPGRTDSITAAAFDVRRQNYVIYDSVNFIPEQAGDTLTRGLELEAVVQPIQALNITAAYSWTPKAEVLESINPEEVGKQATPVPKHQFSTWVDYQMRNGFNVAIGVRYFGSTRGFNESSLEPIPDYTLFDALVGYNWNSWQFAVNAQNLADKEYVASCSGGGLQCYYGATRKIIATVGYRW
jgi:iron complex outermembrane receptor protein